MTVKRVNYKGGKKIPALIIYVQSILRYFLQKNIILKNIILTNIQDNITL